MSTIKRMVPKPMFMMFLPVMTLDRRGSVGRNARRLAGPDFLAYLDPRPRSGAASSSRAHPAINSAIPTLSESKPPWVGTGAVEARLKLCPLGRPRRALTEGCYESP